MNLTLTEMDRLSLGQAYDSGGKAVIRVLGVFEYWNHEFAPPCTLTADPVFVATGDLSMRQTVVPFLEWMRDEFPILREVVPDAKLIIAGKNPSDSLVSACEEYGIELVASPADMDTVLRRGRYYLCPSSKGGGLKLRIMDGLRYGMPVLAHVVSGRGYEPLIGQAVFCYDSADSFRVSLQQMLACTLDAGSITQCYRDLFSFEAGVGRLRDILDSTFGRI